MMPRSGTVEVFHWNQRTEPSAQRKRASNPIKSLPPASSSANSSSVR